MATTAQASITHLESVSQLMLVPKIWFRMPYSPLKSQRQTMVTAAGAQIMGRKKTVRNRPRPLILALRSIATSRAMNTPRGTVRMQK